MSRITKIAAIIGTLFPLSVVAQSIEGTIKNADGNAVADANIRVEGTDLVTKSDSNGYFVLPQVSTGIQELHVTAAGFAHHHADIAIIGTQRKQLTFTLERSPIEVIDVVATPVHMSVMESASPVSVLGGETLRRQQSATLGDTLETLPGVQTSFHANVASTPIIRGLSGPRVMIAQNGLDVGDVSRVGPDHAVASEASTAQQIEVLRGPATLFYGSGAIGGVVNVVDGRVPTDKTTRGEWLLEGDSVNNQKLASFNVTTGVESIAFYADGYWRESDDYETPIAPDLDDVKDDEHKFVVENSNEQSEGVTLGTSYLLDKGFIGLSAEQFNREYGIPGHGHDDEAEDDHGEEERVFADLTQTRVQILGEFEVNGNWLKRINLRSGFTNYEHSEIENGEVGTTFKSDTQELKVDLMHNQFGEWNGGVSFHLKASDTAALGEEAFTPPSTEETIALALMEERHLGAFLLQLGGRIERVTLDADKVLLPEVQLHGIDEKMHETEHEEELHDTASFAFKKDFTPISLSAGLVWDFTPGYNVELSVSRSERAPSTAELLSFGPHIASGSYEIGALFQTHEDEGETHIERSREDTELEVANNIDLALRKKQGQIGFVFNAFYNQVDNYFYQSNTGLFAEGGHEEGEEHSIDEHADELPVFIFRTDDVILHGFEAQMAWQATDTFKTTIFADYVRARLQDGGDLPRTPPLRLGSQFSYQDEQFTAHLDITRYEQQDRITLEETVTDGYTMLDASISYNMPLGGQDVVVYLKGSNLTDTEARVHTSFLKDVAPRPGRSIALGIRGYF
ncbi:TonB-dependent receptor [Alteromonas sp. ASW11-130]|uniref:TonB-dependent receptor n=1 Tax=Alteromonas sp. ASW11-130 TaxID=3015775 RepID=UPI002241E81B|nr:TonB-dependent receptor [Alteromonas sp. ASW11-130]MCW8091217.1 TonB-dependent receptor [Alteromonas sp. ASW11-130]